MHWGKKVGGDLSNPLGIKSERKGRPQQIFCYRTCMRLGGLVMEERKERCGSAIILLVALRVLALGLVVDACWR